VSKNTALEKLDVSNNYFIRQFDITGRDKIQLYRFIYDPQKSRTETLYSIRTIPITSNPSAESAVSPVPMPTAEFIAGPNPASRSSGTVSFFRHGSRVAYATLSIYDASGNVVKKIRVIDDAVGSQTTRKVSSWNLRDTKGRLVPEGTYLVNGTVKTSGGKTERVSLAVGVR